MPAATSINVVSGAPQNATISTAFAKPLVAKVTDANGNRVSGVTVNFIPQGQGAYCTFAGAVNSEQLGCEWLGNRAEVIVLEPELEIWAFVPSPQLERCLCWSQSTRLRDWFEKQGMWPQGHPKPARPKEALERALFVERRPRSSSIYECLG